MTKVKLLPFGKVISDITSNYNKIKKEDYLKEGLFRVIDQGQSFIGGYTNDEGLIRINDLPVIVFGDHTKVFKYVDFPFTIGADGVKVLKVDRERAVAKYIHFYLKTINLPEAGYSRHFKYLKNIKIPLIEPVDEQIRIATILSKAEALIAQRKESLCLLDELLKSTFLEMFGVDYKREKKWKIINLGEVVSTLTDYHANGSYEILRENVVLKNEPDYALMVRTTDLEKNNFDEDCIYLDKKAYNFLGKSKVFGGEIIINKIGSAGKVYLMPYLNRPVSLGMNAFLLRFTNDVNNLFIYYLLTSAYGKHAINKNVKGAVTQTITKEAIRSIKIPKPPIELQTQFVQIVEKVEALKAHYQASLKELENLYGSLSQRAFKGEL